MTATTPARRSDADVTPPGDAVAAVRDVDRRRTCRAAWIDAGRAGGAAAIRAVRTRAEYEEWYPTFAASGLVVPDLAASRTAASI